MDGLWSLCIGERLMIFTMNHSERFDEALLRVGRMDWKIHLLYCRLTAFQILARNYEAHPRMLEAAALLVKVEMTPVDIAEALAILLVAATAVSRCAASLSRRDPPCRHSNLSSKPHDPPRRACSLSGLSGSKLCPSSPRTRQARMPAEPPSLEVLPVRQDSRRQANRGVVEARVRVPFRKAMGRLRLSRSFSCGTIEVGLVDSRIIGKVEFSCELGEKEVPGVFRVPSPGASNEACAGMVNSSLLLPRTFLLE
ncbi:hypothetical protein ZIOFF_063459 [Zingiber officinale]|uniref:AAA+ ATPase At3g28540-like C-terminal domain-containing protein n=1 Tax=Zingiber officinale TaxID=94328 RepID=A0A8J5KGR1_ZINOF|nr:hypothetical protein ZIOFF_063459 [Zingiber officinale]